MVPVHQRAGLIEWVVNTRTLKDLIESELSKERGVPTDLGQNEGPVELRNWISAFGTKYSNKKNLQRL